MAASLSVMAPAVSVTSRGTKEGSTSPFFPTFEKAHMAKTALPRFSSVTFWIVAVADAIDDVEDFAEAVSKIAPAKKVPVSRWVWTVTALYAGSPVQLAHD